MKDNPGTTVNVTPVDWGQAVAKLQTAIAGHQTPDVSQMGTDMMGQFAATGAFENVPASVDKSKFFESAWNTNVVNGATVGVPWYVETRLLYYRKDIADQGRHHQPACHVGRPQGRRPGDEGQGRSQVRDLARYQELAGVRPVPVAERRRHH